ncbi:SH3 domain-containing protein [Chelativorans sp. AA-79]|uniref:SH3 domain-containing protein n=1 Tax=Chelativorans sp. AA-79 TaxID=3028735 RepID=UPI0023F7F334|nr:SH3 domain-containing protein [Chelativorans sp. AA-79]WEX09291.1 SH3 domain-containing protein [Chelativorans sp. AA-79]
MIPRFFLAAVAFGAILASAGTAAAANAFATGNVNMRAGPSTQYPRVTTIPRGSAVEVYGCTSGWRWCDTVWRGNRGWVSASYLQMQYRDRRVYVPDYAPRLGLPVITFQFGSYWDRWYSDRPWYHDRDRWDRRDRDHWDRDRRDRDRWDRDRRDRDRDVWDRDRDRPEPPRRAESNEGGPAQRNNLGLCRLGRC